MLKRKLLQAQTVLRLSNNAHTNTSLSVTLRSADGARAIELSTDDGQEFFVPTYDVNTPTMITLAITTPITHLRIKGAPNDQLIILGEM